MTREAIEYFKFYRKIFCEDHLKICPKDSIAYQATLKEKEFYDMAIKALEQEPNYNSANSLVESKLKNPKAKTFDILHFVADNAGLSTFEAIEKAYNMGVSEQEAVLDKIRAEIDNALSDGMIHKKTVLGIIDKYKEEIEEEK